MNRRLQVTKYVFFDWLAAALAWSMFYIYRKYSENPTVFPNLESVFDDRKFWLGIITWINSTRPLPGERIFLMEAVLLLPCLTLSRGIIGGCILKLTCFMATTIQTTIQQIKLPLMLSTRIISSMCA